ncbi:MAG: beta-ketoacyl-[acyl-carrier-protein] synthase family protein [Planctomycetes bacterium]|nr:beta-ketoacyl-[acyl-carrier-protein] synthase family protein [Planctomycetota bacterium]MCW8134268.1 beta-ketoacyl-[acyl-carrier-protein] synthase family protein [Planctomycetota bacterium]
MANPVAITGLGVVGATGIGVPAMDAAIAAGRDGVGPLTLWQSSLSFPVGQLRDELPANGDRPLSRSDLMALAAAREAVAQAKLADITHGGAIMGQSVCGTLTSEAVYIGARERAKAGVKRRDFAGLLVHEGANTLDALAREFGLCGPTYNVMTACSSAANAIGLAGETILSGRCPVMLAGGADSLSAIAFNGFCSLKVVSPDGPRPFDVNRQGMMVGEGAGVLVLESAEHAKARGAKVLAWLVGWGHSCDAHHLTAPHPEGKGAIAAMRQALERAGLSPGEIGYINAHGTATRDNDSTEAQAINTVFGDKVPVSSTKRFFGHTLAAAGGIEAAVCVRALQTGVLPANLGVRDPEPGIEVLRENRQAQVKHALSNSFGFGGNNAALVFTRNE